MICCESGLIAPLGIGVSCRIRTARNWILDRNHEDAVQLVLRRQRQHAQRPQRLAEALVVEEEEQLVLDDRTAEVHAELVAVERGFLNGVDRAGVAHQVRLEEARRVQVGVADELVQRGVEAGWFRSPMLR